MADTLSEWTERLAINGMVMREERVRALIQPRPRWLPEFVWRRILARLLAIEETPQPAEQSPFRAAQITEGYPYDDREKAAIKRVLNDVHERQSRA